MSLLYFIILGAIAGWLASLVTKGKGSGLLWNIIMGCIGAIVGGLLFDVLFQVHFVNSFLDPLITATLGAVIVIFLGRFVRR